MLICYSTLFFIGLQLLSYCTVLLAGRFKSQATLNRAKFANFKTSHEINYAWKNDLVYDLLAKKKKFADSPTNEILVTSQTGVLYLGHPVLNINMKEK